MCTSTQIAAACVLACILLAGCALPFTSGRLHSSPSTAADLPFPSDRLYVADGDRFPCVEGSETVGAPEDLEGWIFEPNVLSFTDSGGLLGAESLEALASRDPGLNFYQGTYYADGGAVEGRLVVPGLDMSMYRRVVWEYRIVATGPATFYVERQYEGTGVNRVRCYRLGYIQAQ